MEWWQQFLIAAAGGGAVGAFATPWVQWAVEKARLRTHRRRELVDDAWETVRYVRANTTRTRSRTVRMRGIPESPPPTEEIKHDLMQQRAVLKILEHLQRRERRLVEEHHTVDSEHRDGLHALERELRRLRKRWKLS